MAYDYIIKSGCSTTTYDHYHSADISSINSALNSNIPKSAYISSAKVYLDMNHDTVLGTIGNADLNIWFCNSGDSNSGTNLYSGSTNKDSKEITVDISGYLSSRYYPFALSTPYPKIAVYYDSTTRRLYHCDMFKVAFEFYIPTYTLTVNSGTGGTVTGGGTFENGTTTTITATPNTGYIFVKWNDGNTNASRSVTVNSNATYTAEFTPKEYVVTTECISNSDKLGLIRGAGTYKYGDTVSFTITNMSSHHAIKEWYYTTDSMMSGAFGLGDSSVVSITIDESLTGLNVHSSTSIHIVCEIEHTGFYLQAYPSPTGAGKIEYGSYTEDSGYSRLLDFPSSGGMKVSYIGSRTAALKAIPSNGYEFVRWEDGNTDNPRKITITEDASFTAIFEKLTFTVTYKNADGTVLQEIEAEYGDAQPPYTGDTPTLESTVEYDYIFLGWDSESFYIRRDEVVTAVYKEVKRKYIVTFATYPEEGGYSNEGEYPYGTVTTITAIPKDCYEFVRWQDGVTTPSREITVTGDVTYTAYFRINGILSDTSFAEKLLIDQDEIMAILVDETKVYESI